MRGEKAYSLAGSCGSFCRAVIVWFVLPATEASRFPFQTKIHGDTKFSTANWPEGLVVSISPAMIIVANLDCPLKFYAIIRRFCNEVV